MNITFNLAFLLVFQFLFPGSPHLSVSLQEPQTEKTKAAKIVFKSADGGQTWQDISEGLPIPGQNDFNVVREVFFANDQGLYLTAGNGIYQSKPNANAPYWSKALFSNEFSSIAPGKAGIIAYNDGGNISQQISGTSIWLPVYTNFQKTTIRTVFENREGTVFIGTDSGLFKSADGGKTWKQVHAGGWVMKLAEAGGVLLATSMKGIIRSADGGDNWALVISEGGAGIAVENIKDGFAAITYNTSSETRRVRTSYDGGKTWQPVDAGLPASPLIASVIQVGEDFFCGHPDGIFRSTDKGKTWKLILPSFDNKVFNLSVSGSVIYAIPRNGGC